nr:hypothetical protein B9J08_000300 [[Candida] auris]
MQKELQTNVAPKFNQMMLESVQMNDKITKLVEKTCSAAYDLTRKEIMTTVENFGSSQIVPYPGLQFVYDYAKETQRRMIDTIVSSVQVSEEKARLLTEKSVQEIVSIGQKSLGDEFLSDKVFKADLMFTRRRDTIKRQLNDQIEISDFFDPSFSAVLMWMGIPTEVISTTKSQMEVLYPSHLLTALPTSVYSLKKQLPTQLTLQTLYSSTKLLTTGALIRKAYNLSGLLKPSVAKKVVVPLAIFVGGFTVFYLINDIPNAFPRKQARKLKKQVIEMDYAHVNADRISKECRSVLNFPSRQVMNNFQTSIDKRSGEKERLEKEIRTANISAGYFKNLIEKIANETKFVEDIDLEKIHSVD